MLAKNQRTRLLKFLLLAFLPLFLNACVKQIDPNDPEAWKSMPDYVELQALIIEPSEPEGIMVGETKPIHVKVVPSNATFKDLIWQTSSSAIEAYEGNLTARYYNKGFVTVTVKNNAPPSLVRSASVQVKIFSTAFPPPAVKSININPSKQGLLIGQTVTLYPQIVPQEAGNKKVSWSSSATNVAEVNADGIVVAKSLGSAIITATTQDGGKTAQTEVQVLASNQPPTSIEISPKPSAMLVNSSVVLQANVQPDFAVNKQVHWHSSNSAVASLELQTDPNKILVKGNSEGSVQIIATSTVNSSVHSVINLNILNGQSEIDFPLTLPTNTVLRFPKSLHDSQIGKIHKPFSMATTEVSYELWYKVAKWARDTARGTKKYSRYFLANEGSFDYYNQPTARKHHPVTDMWWYDAAIWCNAYTEWHNAHFNTNYTTVYNDGPTPNDGQPIRDFQTAVEKLKNFGDSNALTGTGFRLPTADEWEFSARYAGTVSENNGTCPTHTIEMDNRCYTRGNRASGSLVSAIDTNSVNGEPAKSANNQVAVYGEYAWKNGSQWGYSATGITTTVPVASKQPNFLGFYDISGNVSEWCFDLDSTHLTRERRGGSYKSNSWQLQIGELGASSKPSYSSYDVGLRVVRSQ